MSKITNMFRNFDKKREEKYEKFKPKYHDVFKVKKGFYEGFYFKVIAETTKQITEYKLRGSHDNFYVNVYATKKCKDVLTARLEIGDGFFNSKNVEVAKK